MYHFLLPVLIFIKEKEANKQNLTVLYNKAHCNIYT